MPVNITGEIFIEIEKLILKFIWKWKESRVAKTTLKKEQSCRTNTTDLKTYYKVLVIDSVVIMMSKSANR